MHVRVAPGVQAVRAGEGPEAALRRSEPDAVECHVRDHGHGVAAEDRERIFDPFFTTKDPGEGTGLGLANALRLAEENGGTLELCPPPQDGGACFALRLRTPRAAEPGAARVRAPRST